MMVHNKQASVAVIVAHPDDETLWAGGTILSQPAWHWYVLSLCRGSDPDRRPRFFHALRVFGAEGAMCDLDDGPEQTPLKEDEIRKAILQALPRHSFDLVISHSPAGEYTRHRRHEEIGEAVISLWHRGEIQTAELWTFAYEDGNRRYRPQAILSAHIYQTLPDDIWKRKYDLITNTYGFQTNGFEAETTPRAEAFWRFIDSNDAQKWLMEKRFQYESSIVI